MSIKKSTLQLFLDQHSDKSFAIVITGKQKSGIEKNTVRYLTKSHSNNNENDFIVKLLKEDFRVLLFRNLDQPEFGRIRLDLKCFDLQKKDFELVEEIIHFKENVFEIRYNDFEDFENKLEEMKQTVKKSSVVVTKVVDLSSQLKVVVSHNSKVRL